MAKSTVQRLVDAGVEFTDMSRKQAESIVKSLVKAGEVRRADADKAVQTLLDRSRETSDRVADSVQQELSRQMTWLSERFDELEERLDDLVETVAARVRSEIEAAQASVPAAAKKAPAKKTAAKKTTTKKTPRKKAPATKKAAAPTTAAPADQASEGAGYAPGV
jgi:polyhydroxyalkanoate synthesis regulator phasin